MTYQEYFKEKKEETFRLLNFYEETQKKLANEKESLKTRLEGVTLRLEEARKKLESMPSSLLEPFASIFSFGYFSAEHPLISLGFFPTLYVQEMKRFDKRDSKKFSRKERKSAERRVRFLEKKKNRLEEQKDTVEKRVNSLDEITSRLAKEFVYWNYLEEISQGRLEQISEDGIVYGNKLSASIRGDLMIELFGTVDAPVSIATLTKKDVD